MRTEDQHRILLVEDDLDIAEELKCTLEALGYQPTHVETRDEAEAAVEKTEFCLILMDLQIKASAATLAPRIEAGSTLLKRLRELLPARLPDTTHRTPILVLSAHVRTPVAVRLMQNGATNVLEKPLSKNSLTFEQIIADALEACGRQSHASCPGSAPWMNTEESTPNSATWDLSVLGVRKQQRTQVVLAGTPISLTTAPFVLLLELVLGRARNEWRHKRDLGARDDQGWRGISRLRDQVRPHLPSGIDIVENDNNGGYRLHPQVAVCALDCDKLASHTNARVRQLADLLRDSG